VIPIHGGHDAGQHHEFATPHLTGQPRMVAPGHYEYDRYELKRREDGTLIYLWTETRACCYNARVPGQQPVRPS
jgi:hypothetical protein